MPSPPHCPLHPHCPGLAAWPHSFPLLYLPCGSSPHLPPRPLGPGPCLPLLGSPSPRPHTQPLSSSLWSLLLPVSVSLAPTPSWFSIFPLFIPGPSAPAITARGRPEHPRTLSVPQMGRLLPSPGSFQTTMGGQSSKTPRHRDKHSLSHPIREPRGQWPAALAGGPPVPPVL